MIVYKDKEYRNMQEQVLKNAQDIEALIQGEYALADFGIKVVGQVEDVDDIPNPVSYIEDGGTYGDAFAVGTEEPYYFYILTRANDEHPLPYWFNVGQFPKPGHKVKQVLQVME